MLELEHFWVLLLRVYQAQTSAKWVSSRKCMGSECVVSGKCQELIECQICLSNGPHLEKLVIYYCGFSAGMKFGAMRSGARWEQEKVSS